MAASELLHLAETGKARYLATGDSMGAADWSTYQYQYSNHVRGDNTVEKAVEAGALDARKLYPDMEVQTFEDYAREFYRAKGIVA